MNNDKIGKLRALTDDLSILCIDDSKSLSENMNILLAKFFTTRWIARDGAEGLELFCKHRPDILLTDIAMPKMDGFELSRQVKAIDPDVRIIVLSAYDTKENLHEAINLGIFRYLAKPGKVPVIIDALYDACLAIHNERNKRIFERQLKDIFNYQNNLLMMLHEGKPLLVNQQFLDFFGVKSLESFVHAYRSLDGLLLQHQGFLFSTPEVDWFSRASENPGKLFHTKVMNRDMEVRHLIMKLRLIPDKEGYTIISFDDITDLNLLEIFDGKTAKNDKMIQAKVTVSKLMQVVKDNGAEVKLHNFYRGLTIVNSGILVKADEDEIVIKTTFSQLKAAKLAKNVTVSSEVFPYSVWCKAIKEIDFDEQTITFAEFQFSPNSADQRAFIRLEPEEKRHTVTLFQRDVKFFGAVHIVDISIRSVKISLEVLPAGLAVGEVVKLAMVFETDKQPLNLSTSGTVYRIDTLPRSYNVVVLFELQGANHERLTAYLANRQLELIREFKSC